MKDLDIYMDCNTYLYRGFTFIHYKGGDLDIVSPEYYEVGVRELDLEWVCGNTALKKVLIDGIVDYYDFENRNMEHFPITEQEKEQIKTSFTDEEIALWFPAIKNNINNKT